MSRSRWIYDSSNEWILRQYTEICVKIGESKIALHDCNDKTADDARYLRGVLLSRLDGQVPPFRPGDVVVNDTETDIRPIPERKTSSQKVKNGEEKTVRNVSYYGDRLWGLAFDEVPS